MGLPVIATNWSGPTAFLDASVGYPLPIDGLEEVTEAGAFKVLKIRLHIKCLGRCVCQYARGLHHTCRLLAGAQVGFPFSPAPAEADAPCHAAS